MICLWIRNGSASCPSQQNILKVSGFLVLFHDSSLLIPVVCQVSVSVWSIDGTQLEESRSAPNLRIVCPCTQRHMNPCYSLSVSLPPHSRHSLKPTPLDESLNELLG